ncbi:c3H1-type domain-containing protein [Trichonephila inaurata madagascariensis]|uniref:C3H1-type domain-containing protein n=2 Tax=Trichonephila inaurata madagascariensis TaxID=2747483 RepID=A0A8X6WU91_9ARAC|nr:c3H1-type domain-containing protein [Trichonephila inaurata madagascariensis]
MIASTSFDTFKAWEMSSAPLITPSAWRQVSSISVPAGYCPCIFRETQDFMMSDVEKEEKRDMPNSEIIPKTEVQDLTVCPEYQEKESREIVNEESDEGKPFVGIEGELDFEDETLSPQKTEKSEDQNSASNEVDTQHTQTQKTVESPENQEEGECAPENQEEGECAPENQEEGECPPETPNGKSIEDGEDDGECSDDDDLEEGELKDQDESPKEKQKQVCRFFNRGVCFYGLQCRFLHLNSDLKGNYNMFAPTSRTYDQTIGNVIVPTGQIGIMHNQHRSAVRSAPEFLPGPPIMPSNHSEFSEESAWERGLKEAKELVKKASKRKLDPDFENKRLNLGLNANERNNVEMNDKENDGKYQKKKKEEKKNDLFKYEPPYCDVPYDRDPRGQYERRFENFEIRYTDHGSGEKGGRGLKKKTRRKSSEKTDNTPRFDQRDWRNDRNEDAAKGRGEAYFDPWRRSKSPKIQRPRERSRSFGSCSSVSSYSSRSSCSYSRSSSRSSRECSKRGRSPIYSRSSRSSRSLSMDSVSSASTSVSHSSSGESLITPAQQAALLRAQAENPPVKSESIPGHPPGGLFFQSKKFDKITIGLKNPEYDPFEEEFQNSGPMAPEFPISSDVQNPIPGVERERAKEPVKSLHPPKQQIKLTLLNKNPTQSKLITLPKKDLELNRVQTDITTRSLSRTREKEKCLRGAEKEDLVVVLIEMEETVDSVMNVEDLKEKLMQSKAYLEDEEFVKDFLDTTIDERLEEEERRKRDEEHSTKMEEYRKREEEYRKKAEEPHLERKQELEFAIIEARRKKEIEFRIREARHKEEMEARHRAEVARLMAGEETRLKSGKKESRTVEED